MVHLLRLNIWYVFCDLCEYILCLWDFGIITIWFEMMFLFVQLTFALLCLLGFKTEQQENYET